jgi:hypothetical protein
MKATDLPSFFDVVDGHGLVRDGEAVEQDEPTARNWVDCLQGNWAGNAMEARHIVPLAAIIGRVANLSGEVMPDLNNEESADASVVLAEGLDEDG